MEDFTGKNQGEIAAACMAMQHILIKKGICSFAELSAANSEAQALVGRLGKAFADGSPDTAGMISAIRDMVQFVGGDSAVPSLDKTLSDLEQVISKELK